jgi:hypothetical protein
MNMHRSSKGFGTIAALLIGAVALGSLGLFGVTKIGQERAANESALNTQVLDSQARIMALEDRIDELQGESVGAFRPSGYVGKLLTRLTEGGAESSFRTTPNTAPDGTGLSTTKIGDFIVITVNPGAANEEKISASAVATSTDGSATWTIINRGLSFTENAVVTANKKQHAIGETVIISNDDHFLSTQYPTRDGDETISGQWTFTNFPITASTSFASETVAGVSELATGAEAAATTASGTQARLTLPASIATSTCPTSGNYIPVTSSGTGRIDEGCLDNNFSGTTTFSGYVDGTIASSSIKVYTATSTYTKPDKLRYVVVEVVGAGGGGGNSGGVSAGDAGNGGGSGGYCRRIIPAAALSATTSAGVGTGGGGAATGAAGGPSTFGSFCTGNGGTGGSGSLPGVGGTASGGELNSTGARGGMEGNGANQFGGGAASVLGRTYGGGGDGGASGGGGSSGNDGAVIVREFF